MIYWWVGLAGGIGAALRFFCGRTALSVGFVGWPMATLFVNVVGSFLIGFLMTMFHQKWPVSEELKSAATVGFLGGFTTFSAFSFETVQMLERGQFAKPALYAASTVTLCLLGCWLGVLVAKALIR